MQPSEVGRLLGDLAANAISLRTRPECGLSQGELACVTGLPPSLIRRIERGEVDPHLTTLGVLAEGLHATLEDLMDGLAQSPPRSGLSGPGPGVTQSELARVTALPENLLAQLELGEVDPHLTTLVILAWGLDATIGDLVSGLPALPRRR
jgi:predicted transcriptional regulator